MYSISAVKKRTLLDKAIIFHTIFMDGSDSRHIRQIPTPPMPSCVPYDHLIYIIKFWCHIPGFIKSNGHSFYFGNIRNVRFYCINSLAPGRPRCHFKTANFNLVLLIGIFTSSKDNALRWMPMDLTDDKSTLVQVMAWCRQATSHYLSQCWPSSMSPYGVTRSQWV